jgi:hypothetical protein
MKTKYLAVSLAIVMIAGSMFLVPGASGGKTQVKWMELIYLDADNSLDVSAGAHHVPVVESDYDELMSVGSTSDVVAYVLADRFDGPANLFKIEKGSMTEMKGWAMNGKELNMGDPATLRSVVTYTMKLSKPLHTLLMFWDHGSPQYVAWDDHDGSGGSDALTHNEVIQALSGFHVDIIGADECLVGQLDVMYEYAAKGLSMDFFCASETYTGWRGYPYDRILGELVANPDMNEREAATMMIEQTDLLLSENPYMGEEVNCHAAIDMSKVMALGQSVIDLGKMLSADMKDNAGIVSKARGGANYAYGGNAANLPDLKILVELVAKNSPDASIDAACAIAIANFEVTVIALQATQTLDHQLYGLGIMFPNHSWETPSYYADYEFPSDGWMDFLEAYWGAAGSI